MTKQEWISIFRIQGNDLLERMTNSDKNIRDITLSMNKEIKTFRNQEILSLKKTAELDMWSKEKLLDEILLVTFEDMVRL